MPKKSLGQNFLVDQNILKKIVNQTKIKDENIIEIGPGTGNLTKQILSKKPKSLILIEKDNELYNFLKTKFINKEITIINKDALDVDFSKFKKAKIISNLPYNVSTKIIMKLIFYNKNIINLICMIQKELGNKFDYNKDKMNKYKFIIQYCCDYKILFDVSNKVFYPKPKVKSNVVEFKLKKQRINKKKLLYFVEKLFQKKRKRLGNKLVKKIEINEKVLDKRVEDLNFNELLSIYNLF